MKSITVDDVIEHFGFGWFQIRYLLSLSVIECAVGIGYFSVALLSPLLQCAWNITSFEGALISSTFFAGMTIGTPILCNLADRFGRKSILLISCTIGFFFGVLSTFSPTLHWIYIFRFIAGTIIGGNLSIEATLLSEVCPRRLRAKAESCMFCFWSAGSFIHIGFAALAVQRFGWRLYLFFVSLPLFLAITVVIFIEESPRFLILTQKHDKAKYVFQKMSTRNKVPVPECAIDMHKASTDSSEAGSVRIPFLKEYRVITILLMVAWFISGFAYDGVILISATLPSVRYRCLQNSSAFFPVGKAYADTSCCPTVNNALLVSMAIATVGDFASTIVDAVILDLCGRKVGLSICSVLTGIAFICLDFCMPYVARDIVLLIVRCFSLALIDGLYIYTMELYPTSIRTTALGLGLFLNNASGIFTPYFAQVLIFHNARLTFSIYAVVCIVCAVGIMLIPKETLNTSLPDEIDSQRSETSDTGLLTTDSLPSNYSAVDQQSKDK